MSNEALTERCDPIAHARAEGIAQERARVCALIDSELRNWDDGDRVHEALADMRAWIIRSGEKSK